MTETPSKQRFHFAPGRSGTASGAKTSPGKTIATAGTALIEQRRAAMRFSASVPVEVRVLLEEETFSALKFTGRTLNLSASGMMLEIGDMLSDLYRLMIRRVRMARVDLTLPGITESSSFLCRVVWYDYQGRQESSLCRLGLSFEPMEDKQKSRLKSVLLRLEAATAADE